MTNDKTVTMSRELAESLDCGRNLKVAIDALPELRALLAAPVVERQPAESKYDDEEAQATFESLNPMPRHVTKFKGGYAPTEFNAWAAQDFCKKWDGFKQCAKLYTSPPAPVAVIDPVLGSTPEDHMRWLLDKVVNPSDYPQSVLHDQIRDTLARLDKVKELNR